ncbi:manganese efflux pump [Bariatricus massiliensis]|uniref:Manganese efflux pump n=2 Tax=Bariatricus massiliensis TaxID=1745713 RepID=A0ABS8DJE9_9FIRM|nr:manganese efflux pump [Bariatricus massiliensis]MCB7305423.1 manganese efflux pump [Bariatricus massiliensis]MCB7375977.1 manganese efflux pump [Bariatricus massiliensis]MCB7388566.1 manganese efflux pump [Bariatricus massiliensis]MCB7412739.1 manganese efflux pump [Bariatricus massiliensis]
MPLRRQKGNAIAFDCTYVQSLYHKRRKGSGALRHLLFNKMIIFEYSKRNKDFIQSQESPMHLISSLLFALSANMDTFIVGMSCGIKKDHISLFRNMVISLITLAGTVISISAGLTLAPLLPKKAAQISGSIILILLGLYYIIKSIIIRIKESHKNKLMRISALSAAELPDCSEESTCDIKMTELPPDRHLLPMKDAVLLGLALSINNIGMGIGASITGVELFPTAVLTLAVSMLFLTLGNQLGESTFFKTIRWAADPLSGLILVGLGVYEIFI